MCFQISNRMFMWIRNRRVFALSVADSSSPGVTTAAMWKRQSPIPMLREDVFWQGQTKSAHVFKTILWNRSRCVGAFLHIRQDATNFINSITCTSCEYIVRWLLIFFSLLNVYKPVRFIFIFHNRLLFEYSEWYSKQTVVTHVNS